MRPHVPAADLARRADALRRLAQHAHRDGLSRRSAWYNRRAAALETLANAARREQRS